jgi:hypothetical protein
MKYFILWSALALSFNVFAADEKPSAPYGSALGTVMGFGGAGFMHDSSGFKGIHPSFGGGADIGLHRYLGIFVETGYSRMLSGTLLGSSVSAGILHVAGGLEVTGTNHSRFVPFGKVGMGYGHASGGVPGITVSVNAPAVAFGGGVRAYVNHHFGIETQVLAMRTFKNGSGATLIVPTFGVFLQSK